MSGSCIRVLVVFRRALLLLVLSVAGSVDLTPALAQQLEIVAANGTKVGSNVLSVRAQHLIVAFTAPDGRVFTLRVTQNGFDADFFLGFAFPDCTGTPFLVDNSVVFQSGAVEPTLLPSVSAVPPGNTVYLPIPGSLSQSVTEGSLLDVDGTCEALSEPETVQAFPAQAIGDWLTQFTPPFRVQLSLPASSAATSR